LLSQLRQFRVLRESRLSFESDAMRDDAMRENPLRPPSHAMSFLSEFGVGGEQFGGTAILFHATTTSSSRLNLAE
jgi:hypothetical protein